MKANIGAPDPKLFDEKLTDYTPCGGTRRKVSSFGIGFLAREFILDRDIV
jgi:hypothetical protein